MLLCRRTPYEWVYRRHSYGSHRPNPRGRLIRHASELHETKHRTHPQADPQTTRPHSSPCHIDSHPATDRADNSKGTHHNRVLHAFDRDDTAELARRKQTLHASMHRTKPIFIASINGTPHSRETEAIAWASSSFKTAGFSHSTAFPARSARQAQCACMPCGKAK